MYELDYKILTLVAAATRAVMDGLGTVDVLYSTVLSGAGVSPPFQFFSLCIVALFLAIMAVAYIRGPLAGIVVVLVVLMALYWVYPPIRPLNGPISPAIEQTL